MTRCNARKKLWFLFRKNGQLVRVFINKPKIQYTNNQNLWTDYIGMDYTHYEGDSLQLWTLVGRKYEFTREY